MLHFHVITLFPNTIKAYTEESIMGYAQRKKKVKVSIYNPRDFTKDKHKKADDRPYGGGPGMVLKAEPVLKAVAKAIGRKKKIKVIFFSPSGKQFDIRYARRLSEHYKNIVLIAGHYEGVDARVKKILHAVAVSIGPYVLTGGELPSMVVIDTVVRYIPGVLGSDMSLEEKRIASREVYTRPSIFQYKGKTYRVPRVLLSGHHKKLDAWRAKLSRPKS